MSTLHSVMVVSDESIQIPYLSLTNTHILKYDVGDLNGLQSKTGNTCVIKFQITDHCIDL